MNRLLTALIMVAALFLALGGRAEAHANVTRSDPPAGATLQAAPAEVVIEFSEDLDPSFTRVQIVNSAREVIDAGPGVVDRTNPKILRLALSALPQASYTASWRARSAVDGHITQGNIPFGIGASAGVSLIPPPGTPDPATAPAPPLDSAVRWLSLLLAAVAFGGLPFALFVWRPALAAGRRSQEEIAAADARMSSALKRLILGGGALFLLANVAFLVTQASYAAGVSFFEALGTPVLDLLRGRSGTLWLARVGLTLLLMLLAWRLPTVSGRGAWAWGIGLVLAGMVLATFSLTSHAAAVPEGAAVAVAFDWLHLAAMVAWLGGLLPLALALAATRRDPRHGLPISLLIPRFSALAAISIGLLIATGIYSYFLHIGPVELLAATTYGQAMSAKLGLFVLLLMIAGINLFILSPRLRKMGNDLAKAFGQSVRLELALGALVLLAAGVMTSIAPSKIAWEAQQSLGLRSEVEKDEVDMVFRVAPVQVGDNEFAVDVEDRRPGAAEVPADVLLRFSVPGRASEQFQVEAAKTGERRYLARGSYLSASGRWQVEAILRRPGFDDVRHTFPVDVPPAAAAGTTPRPTPATVTATQSRNGVDVALTILPDPGGDSFTVRLGGLEQAPGEVRLEITPQDFEAGTTEVSLARTEGGEAGPAYSATEPLLSLPGDYLARVTATGMPGGDLRAAFRLDLADDGSLQIAGAPYIRAGLTTEPSPAISGTVQLNIQLLDAGDAPLEDAGVTLTALMPAHGHVAPDIPTQPVAGRPGVYGATLQADMGGEWLLMVYVEGVGEQPLLIDVTFEVIDPSATPTPVAGGQRTEGRGQETGTSGQ